MTIPMLSTRTKIREKIRFEYWPVWLVYLPSLFYWVYLAIKSRAILYMTAANPGIEMGGFFGESKKGILDLVPDHLKPTTIQVNPLETLSASMLQNAGIEFPVVAKPNVGERGNGVEKLEDFPALQRFLADKEEAYLIQEFSPYPLEFGVLFYYLPGAESGEVISITGKKFMALQGDGSSTLRELMTEDFRFSQQIERLGKNIALDRIPKKGEIVYPEPIGNHCRGTEFTNENHRINETVNEVFFGIAKQMDGFYIGRFDLKAKDEKALETGVGLHIMEVNGTTSEPGHIYSKGYGVLNAYRDIFKMMDCVQKVGVACHQKGVPYTPLSEFLHTLRIHFFPGNKSKKSPHDISESVFPQPVH